MLTNLSHYSKILLAIALSSLVSCASKEKQVKLRQAEIYFGAGTQSMMAMEYTEALKNLTKANELDPDNSDILNNLGMAYYFKGEIKTAEKLLLKSLEINKDNSDSKLNLASLYYHQNNIDDAEKLYKNVLKDLTYEKQARTYYNLGLLELEKRKNEGAAENYFKRSIKEDENYCPAFFQMGLIQYGHKQYKTALKHFKDAAVGVCFESPTAHYYQALTLIQLRQFTDARLKLDDIDTRFKKTVYGSKARTKMIELNEIEKNLKTEDSHASRKVLETPEF